MTVSRLQRRIAAILAADVVGYSRLISEDEENTLATLSTYREVVDLLIARHRGRVFGSAGDSFVAEFASPVEAVRCATEIQLEIEKRNADVPEPNRMRFRIGINLGDVVVDGNNLMGDGVNVAARLEGLAEAGGIRVSHTVHDQVQGKLPFRFDDLGERSVKNLTRPIRVFRVVWEGGPVTPPTEPAAEPLQLPNRPSIAVLPFTNMSGGPEQEYFADGLVEDVITNLSKVSGLFVIARNSSFAYKGRQVDIRQIARDLGVRYVLEGSVRRAANRLRITAQLLEGTDGTHVWADKFEGAGEDVFNLQDRLTESIVGAIEPSMRRAEIERARRKRPDSLDAYDLYLQALPHVYANTPAATDEALRLLNESLRLDPKSAVPHAYAAWSYEQRFFRGGFHAADKTAAIGHARIALSLGADDPQALSIGAFAYANMTHDYGTALGALDQALKMNGNSALAFGFSAMLGSFTERYERAIEHALKALRLSPFDPLNYHPYCALAPSYLFTGQFAEAVSYATLAVQSNPLFSPPHVFLVASYAHLDLDAARAAGQRLLEIAPDFTISGFLRNEVYRPHLMQEIAEALRKAGLPD